jgi:hypothetical protein
VRVEIGRRHGIDTRPIALVIEPLKNITINAQMHSHSHFGVVIPRDESNLPLIEIPVDGALELPAGGGVVSDPH